MFFWKVEQVKGVKDGLSQFQFTERADTDFCLKTLAKGIEHNMGPLISKTSGTWNPSGPQKVAVDTIYKKNKIPKFPPIQLMMFGNMTPTTAGLSFRILTAMWG